jgi:aldehyde dehydrogenase (NAD+)
VVNCAINYIPDDVFSIVRVNCYDAITPQTPFGGYKMSGIGREMGPDSVEPYLETKTISIKVPTKV